MSAYTTGEYRNIFLELGYDEQEIKNKLDDMFMTMFHGTDDERIYFEDGDDMGYMTDTGNDDARTEGMSYGMMMAVQLDKKDEFDRIWKWARTNMYLDEGPNKGYFCWSNNLDGSKRARGAAPDGEGIFNYSAEAKVIMNTAVHGNNPMWDPETKYIKFICAGM